MTEASQAARRLKLLRERAGLSMRAVSEALGWTLTRYQHYEDRYRRPYLPLDFARHIADIFAQRGIAAADVLALAGLGGEASQPGPPAERSTFLPRPLVEVPAIPQRDLPVMGAVKGGA